MKSVLRSQKLLKLPTTANTFQYLSDIHLETRRNFKPLSVVSDNMILAGDIGNPFEDNYKEFMKTCSYEYENTFVVAGNHEYWNENGMDETNEQIKNITEKLSNVHYLNRRGIEMDNVYIIGCTLWSHILQPPKKIMGDDINIRDVDWTKLNKIHFSDVEWLEKTLYNILSHEYREGERQEETKIIVITHHLPTYRLLHKKYKNEKCKPYLDRYYTNLEYLIEPPIVAWIGGHSHCSIKKNYNDVFLGINAYGYANKFEKFYRKHKECSFHV